MIDECIMVGIGIFKIPGIVRGITARKVKFLAAMLVLPVTAGVATAAKESQHINVDADGYSINRYDPVAWS